MKHLILSITSLLFCLGLFANPMTTPRVIISELLFENSGKWVLEIEYRNGYTLPIDSIYLVSSKSVIKVPNSYFSKIQGLMVLNSDSLDSGFQINPKGDSITVKYYKYGPGLVFEEVLIFGNCNGAVIETPHEGQSIVKVNNNWVKTNTPSIGEPNSTAGIYGILTGKVYDKYSIPVSKREFQLYYQYDTFVTNEDGTFSTRIYAKPSTFNFLDYPAGLHTTKRVEIIKIDLVMEPDSVVHRDIYLLDTLNLGIQDLALNNPMVRFYPNPLRSSGKLNYEVDLPLRSADCWVELYSIEGKLLTAKQITEQRGEIELPGVKGMVLASFRMDNKLVSTTRIVIASE